MKYLMEDEIDRFKYADNDEQRRKIADKIQKKLEDKKVVVYGAGAVGKVIADIFETLQITIEFFVDRKFYDIKEVNGIPVYNIEKLAECNDKKYVLIIAIDFQLFLEFQGEIGGNIEKYCPEIDVIGHGRELALILRYNICKRKLDKNENFSIVDCINCGGESRGCSVLETYLHNISYKSCKDKSTYKLKNNKFFGCITGNICSLRCKHCCEMVPYYTQRAFSPAVEIIENCKKIADATGFTMYIELIGGEPFLHPEICFMLRELLKIEDVGYIKVFTNGTVVPNQELCEILKNPRIVLVWSNYQDTIEGRLLENVKKTREVLENNGIPYIFSMSKTWLDFSSFDYVEKSKEDLEKDFEDCFLANCHRLYDGVLYRCPHQYAAVRLYGMEATEPDCVEVSKYESLEELSERLYEFKERAYVEACKYCVVPYKAEEVPAGEQIK